MVYVPGVKNWGGETIEECSEHICIKKCKRFSFPKYTSQPTLRLKAARMRHVSARLHLSDVLLRVRLRVRLRLRPPPPSSRVPVLRTALLGWSARPPHDHQRAASAALCTMCVSHPMRRNTAAGSSAAADISFQKEAAAAWHLPQACRLRAVSQHKAMAVATGSRENWKARPHATPAVTAPRTRALVLVRRRLEVLGAPASAHVPCGNVHGSATMTTGALRHVIMARLAV